MIYIFVDNMFFRRYAFKRKVYPSFTASSAGFGW